MGWGPVGGRQSRAARAGVRCRKHVRASARRCAPPCWPLLQAARPCPRACATEGNDLFMEALKIKKSGVFDERCRIIQLDPAEWVVKLSSRSDVLGDELKWEHMYLAYNKDTGDKE